MELEPELLKQLLQVFTVELNEHIQAMTDGLLRLEKGLEGDAQEEVLDSIFRAAHSVKGAARGVGIVDVGEIAHQMESLFSKLKQQNTAPSPEVIDLCLESLDRLRGATEAFNEQKPVDFDLSDLTSRLAHYTPAEGGAKPSGESHSQDLAHPGKNKEKETWESAPAVAIEDAALPETPTQEKQTSAISDRSGAEVIRVAVETVERIGSLAEELQVAKIEMDDHLGAIQQLRTRMETFATLWSHGAPLWQGRDGNGLSEEVERFLGSSKDTIAELSNATRRMHEEMRTSTNQLGFLSSSLQTDVRMMRLVPTSTLLRPLARSVRDIARELGKKVEFEIIGDEIEMDRAILEDLRDPLIHMLRNAVDHGIEEPEERQARGKPETGRLTVRVRSKGNQIIMEVEDDGAGISVSQIVEAAQNRKLLSRSEVEPVGKEEILHLIFRPGLSTKEIITSISGRGVGLDVVRTNLRGLKGSVQVDTKEGEGTRFVLQLPLTLAAEHGLQVRSGGQTYAIPTTSVERVMRLDKEDIVEVEASQAVLIEGGAVPLRDLACVLEVEGHEPPSSDTLAVVAISKGWQTVAFLVEEVIGEREIVVKPLQPPLVSVRNVSGGTLTGSGEIIMVLNGADLVDSALRPGAKSRIFEGEGEAQEVRRPHILVVDDSITTRTLEQNVLASVGYQVSVAVDGKEAWEQLQKERFDLMVTDIAMPVMDGFQLTERIRQSEQLGQIPVIMVTSLASDSDKRRGIEVGADAYIVKSQFETKALIDVVSQLI